MMSRLSIFLLHTQFKKSQFILKVLIYKLQKFFCEQLNNFNLKLKLVIKVRNWNLYNKLNYWPIFFVNPDKKWYFKGTIELFSKRDKNLIGIFDNFE